MAFVKAKRAPVPAEVNKGLISEGRGGRADTTLLNLVKAKKYPNRSRAIQEAVEEKVAKFERSRLADALALLDPIVEKQEAEEGMQNEADSWPTY